MNITYESLIAKKGPGICKASLYPNIKISGEQRTINPSKIVTKKTSLIFNFLNHKAYKRVPTTKY